MSYRVASKLRLNDVTGEIDKGNQYSLVEIAIAMQNQSKALAPVDTGRLRNSITLIKFDLLVCFYPTNHQHLRMQLFHPMHALKLYF